MAYESIFGNKPYVYSSILGLNTNQLNNTDYASALMPSLANVNVGEIAPTGILDSLMSWGKGATGGLFDNFLSKTENGVTTQGWGMPAIGAAQGLMNGILGMKSYGLARDQLNQSKKEFQMNWDAQKKTVNSQLEDRQRARLASNPGAYESLDSYMKKNGI